MGYLSTGTIKNLTLGGNCSVTGYQYTGGICGYNYGTATNCINNGKITGISYVGGIVGRCRSDATSGTVSSCINKGSLSGTYRGGICGWNEGGNITNCYWLNTAYSGSGIGYNQGTSESVASKTSTQFASGEVCWLLQNGQDSQIWGQALGTDDMPGLTAKNKVVKVTIMFGDTELAALYINAGETIVGYPVGYSFFEDEAASVRIDPQTHTYAADATIYARNPLTITAVTAKDKIYDGSKAVTITGGNSGRHWRKRCCRRRHQRPHRHPDQRQYGHLHQTYPHRHRCPHRRRFRKLHPVSAHGVCHDNGRRHHQQSVLQHFFQRYIRPPTRPTTEPPWLSLPKAN